LDKPNLAVGGIRRNLKLKGATGPLRFGSDALDKSNLAVMGRVRRNLKLGRGLPLRGSEPNLAVGESKKGAVLTMDALFALALLLISMTFVLMLLTRYAPYQAPGAGSATDMMDALRTLELQDLDDNPRYPYANMTLHEGTTSPYNATLIEAIADLYMGNNTTGAWNLADEVVGWAVPNDFGVELLIENGTSGKDCSNATSNFSCIYSATRGARRNFASAGRHFIYYNNVTREVRLVLYK